MSTTHISQFIEGVLWNVLTHSTSFDDREGIRSLLLKHARDNPGVSLKSIPINGFVYSWVVLSLMIMIKRGELITPDDLPDATIDLRLYLPERITTHSIDDR